MSEMWNRTDTMHRTHIPEEPLSPSAQIKVEEIDIDSGTMLENLKSELPDGEKTMVEADYKQDFNLSCTSLQAFEKGSAENSRVIPKVEGIKEEPFEYQESFDGYNDSPPGLEDCEDVKPNLLCVAQLQEFSHSEEEEEVCLNPPKREGTSSYDGEEPAGGKPPSRDSVVLGCPGIGVSNTQHSEKKCRKPRGKRRTRLAIQRGAKTAQIKERRAKAVGDAGLSRSKTSADGRSSQRDQLGVPGESTGTCQEKPHDGCQPFEGKTQSDDRLRPCAKASARRRRPVAAEPRPYSCSACSKKFTRSNHLHRHLRLHSQRLECEECKEVFDTRRQYTNHLKGHRNAAGHSCSVCGQIFDYKSKLKKHSVTHMSKKPHACGFCDKSFADRSKLTKHTRVHTGEKPFVCEVCGQCFACNYNLVIHGRTHTGYKPYVCPVCDQAFISKSCLSHHSRTHTGEKSYTCDICAKTFASKYTVVKHMRVHTGERPYGCDICGLAFAVTSTLRRHQILHTGFRPHSCAMCPRAFVLKYNLTLHVRRVHALK